MGSRGLDYCSIFFWKENGGKTEDRSPHPLGLWGIPLRLVQGVGSLGSGWDSCCSVDDWEAQLWQELEYHWFCCCFPPAPALQYTKAKRLGILVLIPSKIATLFLSITPLSPAPQLVPSAPGDLCSGPGAPTLLDSASEPVLWSGPAQTPNQVPH